MRASKFFFATLKEAPADAQVISHKLMLRAGMIRQVASGIYDWLPLGVKVLHKLSNIIRLELNKTGALEVIMPMVQPANLWQESTRWNDYGAELLRFKDRGNRDFVLGPTHEEVITDLVRKEISSYKQLPLNLYQIQTKFRDEVRPRFGVMRSREFLMMDAYSFHLEKISLDETFDLMHKAYSNILEKLNLDFRAVNADTGSIGGSSSVEFQVLAQSGEDDVVFSEFGDYAANIELAEAITLEELAPAQNQIEKLATPNAKTIAELTEQFNFKPEKIVKTLIVKGATEKHPLVALAIRGDHQLNEIKAQKHPLIAEPLTLAEDDEVKKHLGVSIGSIGVVNLEIPLLCDRAVAVLADFVTGANEDGFHFINTNWHRDAKLGEVVDLRNVVEGDPNPKGKGILKITKGIEVGHIFKLGNKYSKAMNATVQGEDGKPVILEMGCYGIGVSRLIAAMIEQNFDDFGIKWPSEAVAPFEIAIVAVNGAKSAQVLTFCEDFYQKLLAQGFDALFDDRPERLGVMLADIELIGVPHLLIVGEKNLKDGFVEYKNRNSGEKQLVALADLEQFVKNLKA